MTEYNNIESVFPYMFCHLANKIPGEFRDNIEYIKLMCNDCHLLLGDKFDLKYNLFKQKFIELATTLFLIFFVFFNRKLSKDIFIKCVILLKDHNDLIINNGL